MMLLRVSKKTKKENIYIYIINFLYLLLAFHTDPITTSLIYLISNNLPNFKFDFITVKNKNKTQVRSCFIPKLSQKNKPDDGI